MKTKIDDFSEIRIGMPVIYSEQDEVLNQKDLLGTAVIEYEARVEGIGWDWCVVRYATALDGEYLALVVDTDRLSYEIPDEEMAKAMLTVSITDRIAALKRGPITFVKGIGEL